MFNLIIALISIALMSYMGINAIYYGGESYADNVSKAISHKFRTQGEQIKGSLAIHKGQGNKIRDEFEVSDLYELGLLKAPLLHWEREDEFFTKIIDEDPNVAIHACYFRNKEAGYTFNKNEQDVINYNRNGVKTVPLCSKSNTDHVPCCARKR